MSQRWLPPGSVWALLEELPSPSRNFWADASAPQMSPCHQITVALDSAKTPGLSWCQRALGWGGKGLCSDIPGESLFHSMGSSGSPRSELLMCPDMCCAHPLPRVSLARAVGLLREVLCHLSPASRPGFVFDINSVAEVPW